MFVVIVQIKNFEFDIMSVFCVVMSTIMFILGIWSARWLWPNCWGKLIVEDDCVIWKCLFCKSRKLYFNDIKIARVCKFQNGNIVKNINIYNTNYGYVLLSSDHKIVNKRIDKINCSKETIKFIFSDKLRNMLEKMLPNPYNQVFSNKFVNKNK